MSQEYPANIVTDDGPGRIHRGHGLDRAMLAADLGWEPGDRGAVVVEEEHFAYVPRIKWCAQLDGFGCDNEGDWHAHWTGVGPNPDCAFTVARVDYHGRPDRIFTPTPEETP